MSVSRYLCLFAAALSLVGLAALPAGQPEPRRPQILLRSSWQTVNIGDVAHTPGMLALLEKYIPEAEVRLWPSNVGDGVAALLRRRFPKLKIVQSADAVQTAFAECDFFLHGSGGSIVATNHLNQWRRETGKPYGLYGITLPRADETSLDIINGAAFAYFRDSVSLKLARDSGAKCPEMAFGPDAAFATDLRDDRRALKFLADNGLAEGTFLCCIGRLRYTPYWKIHGREKTEEDERKHQVSEAKKEQDHAELRRAIVAVVRATGLKVLVCPEDKSQMAVGKEMLVDPLPADVKKSVVWREDFWLPDEALSVYVRSAGLFGNEQHSAIMCIGNGVPAIVCRWEEQTSKGYMWRDIGLGDWLFDTDSAADRERIVPAVLAMAKNPEAARARVARAQEIVRARQEATMKYLAAQFRK